MKQRQHVLRARITHRTKGCFIYIRSCFCVAEPDNSEAGTFDVIVLQIRKGEFGERGIQFNTALSQERYEILTQFVLGSERERL